MCKLTTVQSQRAASPDMFDQLDRIGGDDGEVSAIVTHISDSVTAGFCDVMLTGVHQIMASTTKLSLDKMTGSKYG